MKTKIFTVIFIISILFSINLKAETQISEIEKDIKEILLNCSPSVAKIISEDGRRIISSGVVIDNGYILSHSHIFYPEKDVFVENYKGKRAKVEVVGISRENSLALLKVDEKLFSLPKFGDSSKVEVGDWVVVIGSSINSFPSASFGIVNSTRENEFNVSLATPPGGSGSGVFNSKGELIGILRGAIAEKNFEIFRFERREREGEVVEFPSFSSGGSFSMVIPLNRAKAIYEELKNKGIEKRAYLGVFLRDVGKRVFIEDVEKGSAADKAGLKENDYIISINGKRVYSSDELSSEVKKMRPGEKAVIELERDGKLIKKEIILGEAPRRYFDFPRMEPKTFRRFPVLPGAYLGVLIDTVPEGNEPHKGAYVKKVYKKSPAEKAGLREGDIIISIGKEKVFSPEDIIEIIGKKKAGDNVEISYVRDGKENKCNAILEKRKDWTWYWDWDEFSRYFNEGFKDYMEEMKKAIQSFRERLNSMKIMIKSKKEGIEI
ncbi:MAG: PDZ domain-containing protein [Candidatus Aminicenantia bacterium]